MWDEYLFPASVEEALEILHGHQPPPLPSGAGREIEGIVAEANRALA